jgi:type I restriction enzyme S subunit
LKEKTDAPLIKIANIKLMDLDISSSDFISNTGKLAGANETIKIGDILIGMSGSVGTSAVIREEKLAYINQRILRINSLGIIDPEYLALVINSLVGKMQFEKYGTGGVQVNISPRDMLNIKIPRLGVTEDKIADLIKKSFVAKKQSQQLLADAKARVEQLIEEAANNA